MTWILFDPTRRDFFLSEGKKLKNLTFLGELFLTKTQTINGWPDLTWPQKIDLTRVKNFWPRPITSLLPSWSVPICIKAGHVSSLLVIKKQCSLILNAQRLGYPLLFRAPLTYCSLQEHFFYSSMKARITLLVH